MKNLLVIICFSLAVISCRKENSDLLIGKWRSVRTFTYMHGYDLISEQNQRIEEYTKNNKKITIDNSISWIDTCDYSATNSTITLSGKELNGETWSLKFYYWFAHDSLKIRPFDTFEYYIDTYFIRTN